ncbi:MAG: 16S rRNA (adenine(1518)-N(6)/adenine(1519)-N(6))-dimethyltransferase RsmA [Cyclobacteriaceae bacterium]|jgi:16S rRNA (adenine1518-N6/adenine1519-N6)-dimethyltransferase|nr:16S rRNA (adenine(1518)-N(6)/adenine(1519)-N(6))-dimethyltransferase RsmA [Cyclobacteriaceae bacterium]
MNNGKVRPKKFLGQHFLHDENTARKITEGLLLTDEPTHVVEIGPGMGVLTKYLINDSRINLTLIEIDRDSVAYLKQHYPQLTAKIIEGDFLELGNENLFAQPTSVIGNFPYNISSQIFFKILQNRDKVNQVVCMLQKEVADRIAAKHGNKTYGILSVLLQAFYRVESLLKVPPGVFTPPPKVMSAVIRLVRNERQSLPCSEKLFFLVVKTAFNQRRKTLRNALKNLSLTAQLNTLPVLDKRAEQLSVDDFIALTQQIESSRAGADGI